MSDSEVSYPTADSVCSYAGCERPAWLSCPEGKCLYHSPSNGDSAETARLVWQTARRMAGDKDEMCDFEGWHFPEDPDGHYEGGRPVRGFDGFRFEKRVSFRGATFSGEALFEGATFSGHAGFDGATFSGIAWFRRATFSRHAGFEGATFSEGTEFGGATFSGHAGFDGATFSGNAWFEGATFSGDARFNSATFSGDARFARATFSGDAQFVRATFSGLAGFEGATFSGNTGFNCATFSADAGFEGAMFNGLAEFEGATFGGITGFDDATFRGKAWFHRATFRGIAGFERATFSGDARFEGATFGWDAGFVGARFRPGINIVFDKPGRGRPFRLRCEGETAYRLAKQAAQERGDYADAGNYHYAEQYAIEDNWRRDSEHKPWRKAFWRWWFRLLFGRLIYGYGERPMRPLFIALAVILIWAGFYWLGGAIVPSDPGLEPAARAAYEPDFLECAYCSIVTFTTLGYGDYQPKEPYRLLAASEALLGAALMAVFIVCLSKKYIR